MSSPAPIVYCFALPPIRARLLVHLAAMDVASLSISLGVILTEYEEATYLNPVKDVLDSSCLGRCPLHHRALYTFLGEDLLKPTATLRSNRLRIKRAPVEIRLILLIGCLTTDNAELLLQCRRHILDAIRQDPRCIFYYMGPSYNQQDSHIVLMPSIGTTIYLFNPSTSPSDGCSGILYLEAGILNTILKPSRPPIKQLYVFAHVIEKSHTSMYQDSFNVRDFLWYTEHPYFVFQFKDDCQELAITFNIFLITYPGRTLFQRPWTELKAFLMESIMNRTVLGPTDP